MINAEVILAQSQQAQIARWIWLHFVEILSVKKVQLIIVSKRGNYELIDTKLQWIYGVYFFAVWSPVQTPNTKICSPKVPVGQQSWIFILKG